MRGLPRGMGVEIGDSGAAQLPITLLTASTNILPETTAAGAVAATLSIVGDAYVAPASFLITSGPSGLFEIVGDELLVKSGATFDYETTPSYPVIIEGTDSAPNTYSKTVTVQISNVNEAPTAIQLSANTVNENATDVLIGTLSATDVDLSDTAEFALTVDASGFFEIRNDNQLWAKASAAFDYESAPSHDVTIEVTDGGALTFNDIFTIDVNDVNEAPLDIALSATATSEATEIGDVIAAISSSGDPDVGDTATYTIISDPDNKFQIDGTDLKLDGALDYATATSHDVTIRVSDSGALSFDELFTIDVTEAVEGFEPLQTPSLVFHHWAPNLATIVEADAAGFVSQLGDLGPNNIHLIQASTAAQLETGIVDWDGENALSTIGSVKKFMGTSFTAIDPDHTILFAGEISLGSAWSSMLFRLNPILCRVSTSGDERSVYFGGLAGLTDINGFAGYAGVKTITAIEFDVSAGEVRLYVNGILIATRAGYSGDHTPTIYEVLGSTTQGAHNTGSYAGDVLYEGTPSNEFRQKNEGYMAHELGIVDLLDPAHPYKVTAP